jgi:hypothetical protein
VNQLSYHDRYTPSSCSPFQAEENISLSRKIKQNHEDGLTDSLIRRPPSEVVVANSAGVIDVFGNVA